MLRGGNHGIGAATSQAFAREGAAVLINYLRIPPPDTFAVSGTFDEATGKQDSTITGQGFYHHKRVRSADDVIQAIRAEGGRVEGIEADLADPQTVPMLFELAEKMFGPVDVLVNNADHCEQDTFLPLQFLEVQHLAPDGFATLPFSGELHDKHFAVNSRAVALMIQEFAQRHVRHKKNWGRIINISTDGAPGFEGEISYGASKAALESYSRAAAKELGQYGITVNIVSPGAVQTGWITPEMVQSIAASVPLRRVGQPDDLADVIVFLASEQARWLTGQILSVSGGARMI